MNNNGTPTRQQRRQNRRTVSGSNGGLASASTSAPRPNVPPKLHRQHSVSCSTPNGLRASPASLALLQKLRKSPSGSASSLYAGSKYMEAPAAADIPMPPLKWLPAMPKHLMGSSPTPSTSTMSSISETASESSFDEERRSAIKMPIRMNPMQLIAAVAAAV